MKNLLNIEPSAFHKGRYIGYGNGLWTITKYGGMWRAYRRRDGKVLHRSTLIELSEELLKEANLHGVDDGLIAETAHRKEIGR